MTSKLLLRYSDRHWRIRYALCFKIWTYGSKVVRCNPTSTRDEAKWHAYQAHMYM